MLERLNALAVTVQSPSTVNVYTVHEILGLTQKIEVKLPAISRNGYTTWLTKPPVEELEFEMDCSSYSKWVVI